MMTQFFFTVPAGYTGVGVVGEPFRVPVNRDLPAEEQQQRQYQKTPCERMRDKHKGREHHGKVPVVDPADIAASVFHEPGLERAEKQDADHIADPVGQTDENQYALVQQSRAVEYADDSVQAEPGGGNGKRAFPGLQLRILLACRFIIVCKLFLTAHAFQPGREKAARHFCGIHHPDDPQQPVFVFKTLKQFPGIPDSADAVHNGGNQKKSRTVQQLQIMESGNQREFLFRHDNIPFGGNFLYCPEQIPAETVAAIGEDSRK